MGGHTETQGGVAGDVAAHKLVAAAASLFAAVEEVLAGRVGLW